ncbi:Hypothetical predicted protein, partial [Pelobates cultripes]
CALMPHGVLTGRPSQATTQRFTHQTKAKVQMVMGCLNSHMALGGRHRAQWTLNHPEAMGLTDRTDPAMMPSSRWLSSNSCRNAEPADK